MLFFQDFVLELVRYWTNLGCIWSQPFDLPMGAGTFHPHTFLKGLGKDVWSSVYVQPCRRPVDGRYGKSPYRLQRYYQLQVFLKPAPSEIVDLFLGSLEHIGISLRENDVSLLEDNWEGPTLGAWGLGWEIRANAQEVTQFTYFQQLGGLDLDLICGEITYGLERLYMYRYGLKNVFEIPYNSRFSYADIYYKNEEQFSHYNFHGADISELLDLFSRAEANVSKFCEAKLVLPAYEEVLKASHSFNLLDSRGAISVSQRQKFIGRVRDCARACASLYTRMQSESLANDTVENLCSANNNSLLSNSTDLESYKKEQISRGEGLSTKENTGSRFLIEFGVEEIPPKFLKDFQSFMSNKVNELLLENSFLKHVHADGCPTFEVIASSRRLGVYIENLALGEKDTVEELWGPAYSIAYKDGQLTQAGMGFCKKNGLDPNLIEIKNRDGTRFITGSYKKLGRDTGLFLSEKIYAFMIEYSSRFKKMKWTTRLGVAPFVRPVRWVLSLIDDVVVPFTAFGLKADRYSRGQRILNPDLISIPDAISYFPLLRNASVEPLLENRVTRIRSYLIKYAKNLGAKNLFNEDLIYRNACLCEDPYPFLGDFSDKYLSLPSELIRGTLRENMNYFTLFSSDGKLLPKYIGVASYKCQNVEKMIEGTRDVVAGRLEDGLFYFDEDLKVNIDDLRERLKAQAFQEKCGSVWDKTERLCSIVSEIRNRFPEAFKSIRYDVVLGAAKHCKSDLRTGCVQEFPEEMQGLMASLIMAHQSPFGARSFDISKTIREHYLPIGADTPLPELGESCLLSIIDKMDSLVILMGAGNEIKGSNDPLGLRRLAYGLVRLFSLRPEVEGIYLDDLIQIVGDVASKSGLSASAEVLNKVLLLVHGRFQQYLKQFVTQQAIDGVMSGKSNKVNFKLYSVKNIEMRVKTLHDFLQDSRSKSVLDSYYRARNILSAADAQDVSELQAIKFSDLKGFSSQDELRLFDALSRANSVVPDLLSKSDYGACYPVLFNLASALDCFFEKLMVMDKDKVVRIRRLSILTRYVELFSSVADFDAIQTGVSH